MTNLAAVELKISALKEYLTILARYKDIEAASLINDFEKRGAVERYLYLAMQATIDLAEQVLSYKKLPKPATLADNFRLLAEAGLLDTQLAGRLTKMVGLQNILAHDYRRIDYTLLCTAVRDDVKDLHTLIQEMQSHILPSTER